MAKRKRDEIESSGAGNHVKRQRVQHKIKVGITKIGHAFKISKGLERQKLGRRRKQALGNSKAQDVERIDSEIAALKSAKALDTASSAQQHLFKVLLKNKDVSSHPDLPPEVKKSVVLPSDVASMNVRARLCKANQVTEALNLAVLDVFKALGLEIGSLKPSNKRRLRAKDYAAGDTASNAVTHNVSLEDRSAANGSHYDRELSFSDEDNGDDEFAEGNGGLDAGSISGSKPDVGEDDDVEALERKLASEGYRTKGAERNSNAYDFEDDLLISGLESSGGSASPELQKGHRLGGSSFIPSLTLTGYVEGSGSEVEEEGGVAPRKNRRGQRARRQILEKKYGLRANHLQESNRNAKWDSKRGAIDSSEGRRAHGIHPKPGHRDGRNGHQYRSDSQAEKKAGRKDDSEPIHPSWEAAKRAKQKDAPTAFQGKKITFA